MAIHKITVTSTPNLVTVTGFATQVADKTTLRLVETPVAVSVISDTISVISGGIQGPQGPAGVDATSDEIIVLNKAERRDTVEDVPSVGDITVYYGVADPQTLPSAGSWLVTRLIYTADGGAFDSVKTFAGTGIEDQVWDNHLALSYS